METDRIRELKTTKAVAWAQGLAKDIGICASLVDNIPKETKVPESMKTEYCKTMREWYTELQTLRDEMAAAVNEEDAERLLIQGPTLVIQFQSLVENWRKNVKDFNAPVIEKST